MPLLPRMSSISKTGRVPARDPGSSVHPGRSCIAPFMDNRCPEQRAFGGMDRSWLPKVVGKRGHRRAIRAGQVRAVRDGHDAPRGARPRRTTRRTATESWCARHCGHYRPTAATPPPPPTPCGWRSCTTVTASLPGFGTRTSDTVSTFRARMGES
ncbi:hypothetical protein VTK56DRAFT_2566 [Thermocarpiscus australiensis]